METKELEPIAEPIEPTAELTAETLDFNDASVKALIKKIEDRELTLSASSIKAFMETPRHFIAYKLTDFQTKAMVEGDFLDVLLFTPEEVDKRFVIVPNACNVQSNAGLDAYEKAYNQPFWGKNMNDRKAALAAFRAQDSRTEIKQKMADYYRDIAGKIQRNNAAAFVLGGEREFQKEIAFEAFGWKWRGKIDIFGPHMIADGKLMNNLSISTARRTIEREYLTQAAIYMLGPDFPHKYFYWLCYSRDGHVIVTKEERVRLKMVWADLERTIEQFERCLAFDLWHQSYNFWPRSGIYNLREMNY